MTTKYISVIIAIIVTATSLLSLLITTAINIQVVSALDNSSKEVQAGGGNATAPLMKFTPQKIEINTGQSVIWVNPTTIGEPHTVTFVLDNNTMEGIVSPLAGSNI